MTRRLETRDDLSPLGRLIYDITSILEAHLPSVQDREATLERIERESRSNPPRPTVCRFVDGVLTVSETLTVSESLTSQEAGV